MCFGDENGCFTLLWLVEFLAVESSSFRDSSNRSEKLKDIPRNSDGSIDVFLMDAFEEPNGSGIVTLFGKVRLDSQSTSSSQSPAFASICISIRQVERSLFFLPRMSSGECIPSTFYAFFSSLSFHIRWVISIGHAFPFSHSFRFFVGSFDPQIRSDGSPLYSFDEVAAEIDSILPNQVRILDASFCHSFCFFVLFVCLSVSTYLLSCLSCRPSFMCRVSSSVCVVCCSLF